MSLKRKHSNDEPDAEEGDLFQSEPIEDRKSTFVAYFSPSLKPKDLQNLPVIANADHKILAWRKESNQQSITKAKQYVTGSDDDGEKYAGKKVEKVLEALQAEGACVVARWWGGIMLGPVRFTHIESCAKDAIRECQNQRAEAQMKKRRIEQEEIEHAKLAKALVERDKSIETLRALAMEKENRVKQVRAASQSEQNAQDPPKTETPISNAKPAMHYATMPLDRLRALDKARDATLGFLLKRIDKAEADLAAKNQDGELSKE
ncbi:IMPACT family member C14C8.09c [Pseudocercospora fuligena]|uniref:IMPACT family member C14C8.09c n=1 Tax=Pseudocercospora fuligena TaxID=685502 RepID=A0A8H6RI37_9PEZI|nr:IMPACT family member C14C8.09c [Pseudocercospora fuligena]